LEQFSVGDRLIGVGSTMGPDGEAWISVRLSNGGTGFIAGRLLVSVDEERSVGSEADANPSVQRPERIRASVEPSSRPTQRPTARPSSVSSPTISRPQQDIVNCILPPDGAQVRMEREQCRAQAGLIPR
jgi:hypothetical protein